MYGAPKVAVLKLIGTLTVTVWNCSGQIDEPVHDANAKRPLFVVTLSASRVPFTVVHVLSVAVDL